MPQTYTQAGRPLQVATPLGTDAMLAVGFYGNEGLSQLFRYTIDVITMRATAVGFEALMGQPITVMLEMPGKKARFFNGICVRLLQGESDTDFTDYQLEIVPLAWLLTKRSQSRIFQHITVPEILKKVFDGVTTDFQLTGKFEPRDYCVQYRETDFNFACRLMEEEGIFYFFKHEDGKHTMVVANAPQAHPATTGKLPITYKTVNMAASGDEDYIAELMKVQEHTSGKFVLWDHTFELANASGHEKNAAEKPVTDSVHVGKVAHKLKVGNNTKLEVYDWPGEYAQRFDGIDWAGNEQAAELKKIAPDATRTVDIRMQQEAATAVRIQGSGSARQMSSGYKFTLDTLPSDIVTTPIRIDGEYVITAIQHVCRAPHTYRSGAGGGDGEGFSYANTFAAIPLALPFRPPRTAAKPVVSGSQTAIVVGSKGEEIFTDKYGRIKVQFHWDRENKYDANSSCWVRVAHLSAGRGWGAMSIPRIGQEVIVDFMEGDPDQPICIGCVYNPDQMPRYKLPDEKTKSYIRTNTSMGGVGYNEIRFEDKKDQEQIYVHAQKNMDERVRNDSFERVGNNRHMRVGFYLPNDHKGDLGGESKKGSLFAEIAVDRHTKVHQNSDEQIVGNTKFLVDGTSDTHIKGAVKEKLDATFDQHVIGAVKEKYDATYDQHVTGQYTISIDAGSDLTVGTDLKEKIGASVSQTIGTNFNQKVGSIAAVEAGSIIHLKAGTMIVVEAPMVSLKSGGNFVTVNAAGVQISGMMVLINSGGAAGSGPGAKPQAPKKAADAADAADAKPTKPTDSDHSKTGDKSTK